jgi:hypothetical protein
MNPRDARVLRLGADECVDVVSSRGRVSGIELRLTETIAPGQVFVPFHYAESNANQLTQAAFDPISREPNYKQTACARRAKRRGCWRCLMKKLVVVGNGMAGMGCLEQILKYQPDFDVTVFGDETHVNYNRVLLSSVLAGEKLDDDIVLNPLEWYLKHGIDLHVGVRIVDVDPAEKVVTGDDGSKTPYEVLLLATGSSAWFPPLDGLDKDGVFAFRTLDDTRELIRRSRQGVKAVVIGGGLLGLEAARGLQVQGCDVTVVHIAPTLMERQLDATGGSYLRDKVHALGVRTLLERQTKAILGNGKVTGVSFADGSEVEADLVVVAAGIKPTSSWAGAPASPSTAALSSTTTWRRPTRTSSPLASAWKHNGVLLRHHRAFARASQGAGGDHHRSQGTWLHRHAAGGEAEDRRRGRVFCRSVGRRGRPRAGAVRRRRTRRLQEGRRAQRQAGRVDSRWRYVRPAIATWTGCGRTPTSPSSAGSCCFPRRRRTRARRWPQWPTRPPSAAALA